MSSRCSSSSGTTYSKVGPARPSPRWKQSDAPFRHGPFLDFALPAGQNQQSHPSCFRLLRTLAQFSGVAMYKTVTVCTGIPYYFSLQFAFLPGYVAVTPGIRRHGPYIISNETRISLTAHSPPNRAHCACFGISLISCLRPNLSREFFSRQIGAQFSSANSVPETCAMRTVRGLKCVI